MDFRRKKLKKLEKRKEKRKTEKMKKGDKINGKFRKNIRIL